MDSKLWPIHPQPMPDELLSSWMIRLARGNGYKIHGFYTQFFGLDRQIWNRDIDHLAPRWLITGLSERTGIPESRITQMTLRTLEGYAFERLNDAGTTRWLMALGVFHRTRRAFGQQFCPICLSEDAEPYLRRSWRLALTTICDQHGVVLQDRCNACGRPVVPHRADMTSHRSRLPHMSIVRCSFCRALITAPSTQASDGDIELQRNINEIVAVGYAAIGNSVVYSHLYFDGLRILMAGLSALSNKAGRSVDFERAPILERLARLKAANELLVQWPDVFLAKCATIKKPYSVFTTSKGTNPYWLHHVLRSEILNKPAKLSLAEARAIAHAAEKFTGITTSSNARAFSGRDVGRFLQQPGVSNEVAEMLIASIDQEISEASNQHRLILLRDKVLFIAGRCMHLTMPKLLALNISDFERNKIHNFSFWELPNGESEASTMLAWYIKEVRPKLAQNKIYDAMFISTMGRNFGESAAGMRFTRATQRAGLTRAITNWTLWNNSINRSNSNHVLRNFKD
jgi:TniQ